MHCPNCDYVLWNLTTRACPECGTTFKPSEFAFLPNQVQFVCPDCDQQYYGTDVNGHLVPREFDCARCGRHLQMDEMLLRPHDPRERVAVMRSLMPWQERQTRGRVKCWFETMGRAMTRPKELLLSVPVQSSAGEAWVYALTTTIIFHVVAIVPCCLIDGLSSATPMSGSGSLEVALKDMLLMLLWPLGFVFTTMALLALWGLSTHAMLCWVAKPNAGLGRTYHALCYTAGANAFTAIPCFGIIMGWIWWLVSGGIAVAAAHRVSEGKAMLAVLTLPTILLILGFGYAAFKVIVET